MKRAIVLGSVMALLLLVFAAPAGAVPPEEFTDSFDITIVSDEACPGAFVNYVGEVRGKVYFDQDGNPLRMVSHVKEVGTYGGFGTTLTGKDSYTETAYGDGSWVTTGLYSKVTVPGSGVVFLDVGRVSFSPDTGFTVAGRHDWFGNFGPLCEAVGGTPG
jgi:hypothetical protein